MSRDAISVVMPARNASLTIADAINSILHQTYSNLELIIVDDNSEDNTFQIASMFASDNEHVQVFEMPYDAKRYNEVIEVFEPLYGRIKQKISDEEDYIENYMVLFMVYIIIY